MTTLDVFRSSEEGVDDASGQVVAPKRLPSVGRPVPVALLPAPPPAPRPVPELDPGAIAGRPARGAVRPIPVPELDLAAAEASAAHALLPTPPDDDEKFSWIDREMPVLIAFSLIAMACLTISQLYFVMIEPMLLVFVPVIIFTLGYYLLSLRINVGSRNFDVRAHRALVSDWAPTEYPTVDVLLPICHEEQAVIRNTWNYVADMAATYPGRTTVYVLDDGDSPDARRLAEEMGFVYHVRENLGWFKKAGNLRAGFDISDGEYQVIFDADFAPRADFLLETLPHLDDDPGIGILQTPQFFRASPEQSWMERGAGSVQELFYRLTQVSRNRFGASICVGSCAVYRRAALEETGGMALVDHSEDVFTGFEMTVHGWRVAYLPVPLATGLCPPDPDSFLTQQYRWCVGSMAMLRSRSFWSSPLPPWNRGCFISGFMYYIHTALFAFLAPVIPIILLAFLPGHVRAANYLWILPSIAYGVVVFPLWNRGRYGVTSAMAKMLYAWAHVFAIWDMLVARPMEWQTTGSRSGKSHTRRIWVAMSLWVGATATLWIGLAVVRMAEVSVIDFAFLFGAGLVYAALPTMAVLEWRRSVAD